MKLERLAVTGLLATLILGGCQNDDLDLGGSSESSVEQTPPGSDSGTTEASATDSATADSATTDSATSSCHGWCLEHTAGIADYYYFGLWCSSPNDCYAVGQEARIEHWNGTSWTTDPLTGLSAAVTYPFGGKVRFLTVNGTGPNDVWVGGDDHVLLHFDGTSWSASQPAPSDPTVGPNMYIDMTVLNPNNVYLVGGSGETTHWTSAGGLSTAESLPKPNSVDLTSIWSKNQNDIWIVGTDWDQPVDPQGFPQGVARHWNGTSWSMQNLPKNASVIHGFTSNDIWGVGGGGAVIHYDGSTWIAVSAPTDWFLNDVWGKNANDVWAVGNKTVHYDGTSWTEVAAPVEGGLNPIHGLLAVAGAGSTLRAVGGDRIYRYVP